VDQFLETVATRIVATNVLVDELRRELAEARATPVPSPAPAPSDLSTLDDDALVRLIGEETTTVLTTARRAAEEIRSKAEESAARLIREANTEADQVTGEARERAATLHAEADEALDQAVRAAEAEARRIRDEAEQESQSLITEAREQADATMAETAEARAAAEAEAEQVVADARDEGRGMVAEAKAVRVRILEDLQRRRDLAREQIERLLAGRERLLGAYELVRENLDDITGQLADSLPDPGAGMDTEYPDGFVGIVGASEADDESSEAGAEELAAADGAVGDTEHEGHGEPVDGDGAPGDVETELDDTVAPVTATPTPAPADETGHDDAGAVDDGADEVGDVEAGRDAAGDVEAGDDEAGGVEAEDVGVEVEVEDDAEVEPEVGAEVDAEVASEVDDGRGAETDDGAETDAEPGGDVDALFARLRAERSASAAKARQLLDDADEAAVESGPDEEEPVAAAPDGEALADDASADDIADTAPAADRAPDVDRVPAEFLATEEDLARRADALGPLDDALRRALKRHLADEQNELLDLLRRTGSTAPADLLPEAETQVSGYAHIARAHLVAATAAGAGAAGDESATVGDDEVADLAQALGGILVEPFRRRVERSAGEVDGDPDELDERLRALYREWKVQHIGPAAEDALLSAYALGTVTAAGTGALVRWRIDPHQGPCPDAQDNALADDVSAGQAFPTGDGCPQAHPGCRCLLVVAEGAVVG